MIRVLTIPNKLKQRAVIASAVKLDKLFMEEKSQKIKKNEENGSYFISFDKKTMRTEEKFIRTLFTIERT